MLAALIRVLGDFEFAEEACALALRKWGGSAGRPVAWLLTAARRRVHRNQIVEVTVAAAVGAALRTSDACRHDIHHKTRAEPGSPSRTTAVGRREEAR
ncbi:hypothetical protein [Actinophytocola sp.]|uniref:hypothetical protein n=1 Tax=Actinophytocola sp. TaxID=1872138 RepID=UPI003D6B3262